MIDEYRFLDSRAVHVPRPWGELRAFISTAAYTLKIVYRYPTNIAWMVVLPIAYIFMGTVMTRFVDWTDLAQLTGRQVDYLQFILSGMAMWLFSNASLGLASSVEAEIMSGTAQTAFATPTRGATFLLGLMAAGFVPSLGIAALVAVFLGVTHKGAALGRALPSFIVALAVYVGIGLMMSAASLRYRRIGRLASLLPFFEQFFSGIFLPVNAIPIWLRALSFLSPTTWAIDIVRSSLLRLNPLLPYAIEWPLLVALAAVSLCAGSWAVRRAMKRVAELGIGEMY
ncbi:MAG: ABC transporter permease [Acetobacteraceae bacterium]|nr:ABC transporter permease [Acetobacteraceae bacterium]